jgi:hypothetical protein
VVSQLALQQGQLRGLTNGWSFLHCFRSSARRAWAKALCSSVVHPLPARKPPPPLCVCYLLMSVGLQWQEAWYSQLYITGSNAYL